MNIVRSLIFAATLATLVACGPKVKVSNSLDALKSKSMAILPPVTESSISRERVEYITFVLGTELRSAGYIILDPKAVSAVCPTSDCPKEKRQQLASKYLVDSFAELKLESVARNNFVAGYYNTIAGQLRITDVNAADIVSVEHTESERGGLLFNSGQILQGIISQVKNAGEAPFERLASKFVDTLVSKIPGNQTDTIGADAAAVVIQSVKTHEVKPLLYQICTKATPNSMASVIVGKKKASLREVTIGEYCGNFSLEALAGVSPLAVEVRSPFGNAAREDLKAPFEPPCSLKNNVQLVGQGKVSIACADGANHFDVYRSTKDPEIGPFEKVARTKSQNWNDTAQFKDVPTYVVVSVNDKGARSLPVEAQKAASDKS